MILLDLLDMEICKYRKRLLGLTYDFNEEHDTDIKPIAKSEAHSKKWMDAYPFYANVQRERGELYGTCMELSDSGNVKALVRYRIEKAKSDLQSAQILIREKDTGMQITESTMQYQQFMLWMESYINVIKIHWQILIKIMLELKFFQKLLEEKLLRQRKFAMPVIMMIFIPQAGIKALSRYRMQKNWWRKHRC